jgi:hypothetical protein
MSWHVVCLVGFPGAPLLELHVAALLAAFEQVGMSFSLLVLFGRWRFLGSRLLGSQFLHGLREGQPLG